MEPLAGSLGEEWFEAKCTGHPETGAPCDRTWSARGVIRSRDALARAQAHADRMGHIIDAQHGNIRPPVRAK